MKATAEVTRKPGKDACRLVCKTGRGRTVMLEGDLAELEGVSVMEMPTPPSSGQRPSCRLRMRA